MIQESARHPKYCVPISTYQHQVYHRSPARAQRQTVIGCRWPADDPIGRQHESCSRCKQGAATRLRNLRLHTRETEQSQTTHHIKSGGSVV